MADTNMYNMSIAFEADGLWTEPTNKPVDTMDEPLVNYKKCKLVKKHHDGAVWIVYSIDHHGVQGGAADSKVVYPETEGTVVSTSFSIKSAQAFNVTTPCICLFEHPKFMGHLHATPTSINDLTAEFPGSWRGVSSVIALSGKWRLYTGTDGQGRFKDMDATMGRQELSSLEALGDKVKSVKLIHE